MDHSYDSQSELILDQRRAQDEFTLQLVDAVSPPILQGFVSLQQAAIKLCEEQGENEKYLMMFQNMIARIPGWNATLITKEVERIIDSSQIGYLPDLVTAVHIIHLRILSSVRVGSKPKHIELDPPDFEQFIHKVYCECGRKMWTHAYLFRTDINDIDYQRNMHECEKIIRDAVICTIRATLPVENILRAYIEEAEEIRVEEEIEEEFSKQIEQTPQANEIQNEKAIESVNQSDVKNLMSTGLAVLKDTERETVHDAESIVTETLNTDALDEVQEDAQEVDDRQLKPNVVFAANNEMLDMGTNKTSVVDMAPPPRSPAPMPGPPLEEVSLRSLAPTTNSTSPSSQPSDPLEVIDLNMNTSPTSATMPTLKLDMSDF
jgi:hypothetical protein